MAARKIPQQGLGINPLLTTIAGTITPEGEQPCSRLPSRVGWPEYRKAAAHLAGGAVDPTLSGSPRTSRISDAFIWGERLFATWDCIRYLATLQNHRPD